MLYRPGDSFLHRADPRAKIAVVLIVLALALTTTRVDSQLVLLLAVVLGLQILGGISVKTYWKAVAVVVPLIVLLVLIQALLQSGPPIATIGGVELSEAGVLLGLGIGIRLFAMGVAFYGFSVTTSPTAICLALHKTGMPYKMAFLTSFAFRFLPLIQDEARGLLTAMSVRGSAQPASRNPFQRGTAIVRMLFPMLVGSMRRSGEIALSMELRGYALPGPRTFVQKLKFKYADSAFLTGTALLGACLIFVRIQDFTLLNLGVQL